MNSDLSDALSEFMQQVDSFRRDLKNKGALTPLDSWIPPLKTICKKIKRCVRLLSPSAIKHFVKEKLEMFYKVYDTFKGDYFKIYIKVTTDADVVQIIDGFFGMFLINNPKRFIQYLPTRIFNYFIRGITYFRNERLINENPLYHRPLSCGSRTLPIDKKFKITNLSENTAEDRRLAMQQCYIERRIYDILYEKIIGEQDFAHAMELVKMERLYQEMYGFSLPSVKIMAYKNSIEPIRLHIDFSLRHSETYQKTEGIVKATKREGAQYFCKNQTEDHEATWSPTPPTSRLHAVST